MSAGITWHPEAPSYSLGRAVIYSLLIHISLFLMLVLSDFITPWKSKPRVLTFKNLHVGTIDVSAKPATKPKGVERPLDVTNPSPPTPPKPKPLPTPQTKPVVKKSALKPIPTPKTPAVKTPKPLPPVKNAHKVVSKVPIKKILATPTPEPPTEEPEVAETSEKSADSDKNKSSKSDLDQIPSIPNNYTGPVVEAQGVKDGGNTGGLPITTEEGITLPGEYLVDAFRRIQANFNPPSTVDKRYPKAIVCMISFRVALDGRISDAQVRQSCGDAALDDYAIRTIVKTVSLLPLKDLIKVNLGKDYVTAIVPFSFGGNAAQ